MLESATASRVDDLKLVLMHQANKRINEYCAEGPGPARREGAAQHPASTATPRPPPSRCSGTSARATGRLRPGRPGADGGLRRRHDLGRDPGAGLTRTDAEEATMRTLNLLATDGSRRGHGLGAASARCSVGTASRARRARRPSGVICGARTASDPGTQIPVSVVNGAEARAGAGARRGHPRLRVHVDRGPAARARAARPRSG